VDMFVFYFDGGEEKKKTADKNTGGLFIAKYGQISKYFYN